MQKKITVLALCFLCLFIRSVKSQEYPGFRVIGCHLYDQCGEKVVLPGVANPNIWFEKNGIPRYAEIEKTGTNAIRIVWKISGTADDLNSISNTSVRPYNLVNRLCNPTGIQTLANYLSTGIKYFQNYPNPFKSITQITYGLDHQTHVKLAVYNSLGEEIEVLVNAFQTAGEYSIIFNSSAIAAGIYFCTLTTLEERELHMMIRVK